MTNEKLISFGVKNYLLSNIKHNENILISLSCGLDSTVLFDLIQKSKFLNSQNIFYLIFDHQKRPEGKYEIKQFINYYNLTNKNIFVKKISLKNKFTGFQEKSRLSRYKYLYSFSKKRNIKNIFLGHHLDDLNETFFMRKIQQSGNAGLSNIFLKNYKDIKLHRPLHIYSKNQIKNYANLNKLIWFEDRSNSEIDYTRNKIRKYLHDNNLLPRINRERKQFSKIFYLQTLHESFFNRKRYKIFEIDINKFNNLNENLKFFVIQSFYYTYRDLIKKQIRDENIRNVVKKLKSQFQKGKEMSVFSGKIGVINKKICINLT